jgi:hypothetical protein
MESEASVAVSKNDRLFSVTPEDAAWETFHYDPADDTFAIVSKQDVTELAERNKRLFNAAERSTPHGEFAHYASIPGNVYADLVKRGIANDEKAFKAWLEDPDNRVFRTRPGKI